MKERELIELAALAAGYELSKHIYESSKGVQKVQEYSCWDGDGVMWGGWNPLANDGDAFRLMVKLGFTVKVSTDAPIKNVTCFKGSGGASVMERIEGNEYAATRRAIVRAAAEIGKEK